MIVYATVQDGDPEEEEAPERPPAHMTLSSTRALQTQLTVCSRQSIEADKPVKTNTSRPHVNAWLSDAEVSKQESIETFQERRVSVLSPNPVPNVKMNLY